MRKKTSVWAWAVLFIAGLLLLTGCYALDQGIAGVVPPLDANADGILDQAYIDFVNNTGGTANLVTGGAFAPWISLVEAIIIGLSGAGVAGYGVYRKMKKKPSV